MVCKYVTNVPTERNLVESLNISNLERNLVESSDPFKHHDV